MYIVHFSFYLSVIGTAEEQERRMEQRRVDALTRTKVEFVRGTHSAPSLSTFASSSRLMSGPTPSSSSSSSTSNAPTTTTSTSVTSTGVVVRRIVQKKKWDQK
jgi:hypothetical protein